VRKPIRAGTRARRLDYSIAKVGFSIRRDALALKR
jgi:hypothetical protein